MSDAILLSVLAVFWAAFLALLVAQVIAQREWAQERKRLIASLLATNASEYRLLVNDPPPAADRPEKREPPVEQIGV